MTASPTGEVIILLVSLCVFSFFLWQEITRRETTWRFRISDFFVKRPQNPDEKNGAAVAMGIVLIGLLLLLLFQRLNKLLW